jgi:hypothetical protein
MVTHVSAILSPLYWVWNRQSSKICTNRRQILCKGHTSGTYWSLHKTSLDWVFLLLKLVKLRCKIVTFIWFSRGKIKLILKMKTCELEAQAVECLPCKQEAYKPESWYWFKSQYQAPPKKNFIKNKYACKENCITLIWKEEKLRNLMEISRNAS